MAEHDPRLALVLARRILRFVSLAAGFLVLISLMAIAEALAIRVGWPHLGNQSMPRRVSIGEFAISPDGKLGVSRITFVGGKAKRVANDIVLHNLHGPSAGRLHIERHRPQSAAVSPVTDKLIGNPSVLIVQELPEPLDEKDAPAMDAALQQARTGRTLVVIPSRLAMLRAADRVFLIHQGRLDAEGSHAELLHANALYRHLNYVLFTPFRGVMPCGPNDVR